MPPKASKQPKAQPRTKATPKKPLSAAERLKRLFVSLCAQIDGGHFKNALKTCDKILHVDSTDRDALQAKLFLLLQTEQYDAALSHVEALKVQDHSAFERAYIFYCLHREEEARLLLKDLNGEQNKGVLHLEAQISYRQGCYEAAFDMYAQLLDTSEPNTEEHSDITNNLQASHKLLDFVSTDYLRSLDRLPASISSSLETSLPPQPAIHHVSTTVVSAQKGADKDEIKKVRKARVPRGVVPGVTPPPDPERWLKKSERSTYATGKKRKGGGGTTQGIMESSNTQNTPSKSATKGKKRR